MTAVFSSVDLTNRQNPIANEFVSHVEDILEHPMFLQLDNYSQHLNTSRLQHSLNVAYYTFLFARKLKLNVKEAVRGALLHDLFLYEWRTEQPEVGKHVNVHPAQALKNAKRMLDEVTPIMEDVIVNHMWPMGDAAPKSKEAWLVQAMDKYCAGLEFGVQTNKMSLLYNVTPLMVSMLIMIK